MRKSCLGNCYDRGKMVELFGEETIVKLESENCDYTNRVMEPCDEAVEFSASITVFDNDFNRCIITAYYYQDDPIEVENLDELAWEIDCYEITRI